MSQTIRKLYKTSVIAALLKSIENVFVLKKKQKKTENERKMKAFNKE